MEALNQAILETEQLLRTSTPQLETAQRAWEAQLPLWQTLTAVEQVSLAGASLEPKEDGSIFVQGKNPTPDTYRLTYDQIPSGMTAIRIDVIPDPALPAQGSGRAGNGNFVLTELILSSNSLSGKFCS